MCNKTPDWDVPMGGRGKGALRYSLGFQILVLDTVTLEWEK
jgi:hypothetical protein